MDMLGMHVYLRRKIVQEEEDGSTMTVIGMMLAKVFMFERLSDE